MMKGELRDYYDIWIKQGHQFIKLKATTSCRLTTQPTQPTAHTRCGATAGNDKQQRHIK
jgi:hypothetical protein